MRPPLQHLAAAMREAERKFREAAERTKNTRPNTEDAINVRDLINADKAVIAARRAYQEAIERETAI